MTTENVAILFTDIVGSTELSPRLSADMVDEVRRGHCSVLRRAIAGTGGTEVKNLGDGVMVVFASASAALECGVAMQQLVDQANRGGAACIGLRVGISGGEVDHEEDDYFGGPVVEAARLCARCTGGQVLAADIVPAMAGRRNKIGHRTLGDLELKGLPVPVATVEVLWEPLEGIGGDVPLPDRLAVGPGVGVVGRVGELQVLAGGFKRVSGDDVPELVLVSGEAGQGKTTFVAEGARAAFDQGACVLLGRCEEDLATPYQLFAEALTHYVTHAPDALLVARADAFGSELQRLVPALGQRLPGLPPTADTDPDTERYLLFAALGGLFAAMSQEQPVVLVLDDLQWADTGSPQLLRHLMSSDQKMRLLVVGTYRDNELSCAHPLLDTLGALRRHDGVSRIELRGFDDAGVVDFLEASGGRMLDDAGTGLALAVYRETDGNPFFVSEVLRHLVDTGSIYPDAVGRWVGTEGPACPVVRTDHPERGPDAGRVLDVVRGHRRQGVPQAGGRGDVPGEVRGEAPGAPVRRPGRPSRRVRLAPGSVAAPAGPLR
jgi:class 3 adenylate cyclase